MTTTTPTTAVPASGDALAAWHGLLFDGAWRPGRGGTPEVTAPATGEVIATVGAASPADVGQAVESAARAQRDWARLPYDRRADVFRRAAALLEAGPGQPTRAG
uniref:aldehyde dehydrogenase family protein n=1 Tax=Streptomyces phaeolivaceus TaxID=2653200 RepID=UPI00384BA923